MGMTPFLIIVFLYMFMMMGTRPSIPLLASELGSDSFQIGMIVSLFSLVPLFFSIGIGKWVDQFHSKKTLLTGGYFGVIAIGLVGFVTTFTGLYLSQIVGGLMFTVFMLSAQNYLARTSHPDHLQQNVGWFSISVALGSVAGPVFCGFLADYWGFQRVFQVNSLAGLLAVLPIHYLQDESPSLSHNANGEKKVSKSILDLLSTPAIRFALSMSVLMMFAKDIFSSFFPLLAQRMGYSNTLIGVLLSTHGITTVISRFLMSKLVDQFGFQKIFLWSLTCTSASLFFLPIFNPFLVLMINVGILGLVLGMGLPLSMSITMKGAPDGRVGEALGMRLTVNRFTQCVTPFIFGIFSSVFGISSIFYASAIAIVLGTNFVFKKAVSEATNKSLSK